MQMIVDVGMSPEEYAVRGGHETVAAPVGCPNPVCGQQGRLHRHQKYERGLSGLPSGFWVMCFLCAACGRSVSCLPSFALPYRFVRVKTVGAFLGGRAGDADAERHRRILQRYRKDLGAHLPLLARRTGQYLAREMFGSAKAFWAGLAQKCGDWMEGVRSLAMKFGMGLLRSYAVHAWARAAVCGVGSFKRRVRRESG